MFHVDCPQKQQHLLWFCHMTYCKPFVTIQNLGQWEFCNHQVISPGNGVFASNFSEKDALIWRYPPIIILPRWEYSLGTIDFCRKMKSPKSSDYATVIPVCMNYKHMFMTGQKHFLKQKMHSLYWKALNSSNFMVSQAYLNLFRRLCIKLFYRPKHVGWLDS